MARAAAGRARACDESSSEVLEPLNQLLIDEFAPHHLAEWSERSSMHIALFAAATRVLGLPDERG